MSSSEDDTPLVKAKDQGEFGDNIPRRHRRFHARRGLLLRDEPFPVSEAQASFQLHQRPPSSTTITLDLPPQSSWLIIPPPQRSQMTAYRKPKTKPWTSRFPQMAMSNRAFPFAWAQSTPWTLMRQRREWKAQGACQLDQRQNIQGRQQLRGRRQATCAFFPITIRTCYALTISRASGGEHPSKRKLSRTTTTPNSATCL
jgi:hypothetical protein